MAGQNVEHRIDIKVTAAGAARVATDLDKLVGAEGALVAATDKTSKIFERQEQALERLARRYDQQYRLTRQAEEAQKLLDRASGAGLAGTESYQRAMAALSKSQQDNVKMTALQRHEWVNLTRQAQDIVTMAAMGASPMQILTSQGAQIFDIFSSSRGGATAALREFGAVATRALFSPVGAAGALAASVAAIGFEASKTQRQLAELATQSRTSGLSAETIQGAKVIGAGVGLDEKASFGAFSTAGRAFEQYGRNSGSVLSTLQQVDKSFLGVLDKARSAGEFVDLLNTKIAQLPTRQAEQLAAALYGDEAAKRLLDSIRAGEVSMRALREASGATGQSLGQSATAAEQMQYKIAAAAQEADNKLLVAFRNIKSPTDDIKLGWYGVVGAIADAVQQSEKLQRVMSAMTSWSALFKEIGRGYDAVDKMLGARPVSRLEDERPRLARPGDIPFPNFAEARAGFLPKLMNPTVGESRSLFTKAEGRHGKSDAEKSAERFSSITHDLQRQIELVNAVGAEHEKVALLIRVEAEQQKLGVGATMQQKDAVGALVTKLEQAERSQKTLNDAVREMGDAAGSALKGFIGDLREGDSVGKSLASTLDRLQTKLISKGIDSLVDVGSNALKEHGGGLFSSIGSGLKSLWPFEAGGIMTSMGPVPLHRYASGGIADSPQLAMFGEGSRPEAYVPLPDGRRIPVAMDGGAGANVTVINQAAGVQVTPRVTHSDVVLLVQEIGAQMIRENNRQVPGLVADAQKRRNR